MTCLLLKEVRMLRLSRSASSLRVKLMHLSHLVVFGEKLYLTSRLLGL